MHWERTASAVPRLCAKLAPERPFWYELDPLWGNGHEKHMRNDVVGALARYPDVDVLGTS
jgi:hypothetical protein